MITLAIDGFDGRKPLGNAGQDYPKLYYYMKEKGIDVQCMPTEQALHTAWYPIHIKWFDLTVDYLALVNPIAIEKGMKIVFLYHEADNPEHISERLAYMSVKHKHDNMAFISGNSAANQHPFMYYWPEIEYRFQQQNDFTKAAQKHLNRRTRRFMVLCRIDKLWRKMFMSELWKKNFHKQNYFSYLQEQLGEHEDPGPLSDKLVEQYSAQVMDFVKAGPFHADDLTSDEANDFSIQPVELYTDSYINIVLETFIDVDSSGGQFITEKTFKPIMHNQMFICMAEHHHLKHLRELGYQTFDGIIDESYDNIEDTELRFNTVLKLIKSINQMPMATVHELYRMSQDIIQHNSEILQSDLTTRSKQVLDRLSK